MMEGARILRSERYQVSLIASLIACLGVFFLLSLAPIGQAHAEGEDGITGGASIQAVHNLTISEDTTWDRDELSDGGRWTVTVQPGVTLTINETQHMMSSSYVVFNGGGTLLRGADCTGDMIAMEGSSEAELTLNNVTMDGNRGAIPTGSRIRVHNNATEYAGGVNKL